MGALVGVMESQFLDGFEVTDRTRELLTANGWANPEPKRRRIFLLNNSEGSSRVRDVFAPQLTGKADNTALFDEAIIVLDTNVLLRLYEWSGPTADTFLNMLSVVAERMWLPYQVGWEFFRNRTIVRRSLYLEHDALLKILRTLQKKLKADNRLRSHVTGNTGERDNFLDAVQKYARHLDKEKRQLKTAANTEPDSVLNRILGLYEGRAAEAPSKGWVEKRTQEGKLRFADRVPPGYADGGFADKRSKDDNVYGDYFLWRECLDHAKKVQSPMVIVTNDAKEDWWLRDENNTIAPRPELLQEFFNRTGQKVLILSVEDFHSELTARTPDTDARADAESIRDEIAVPERSVEDVMAEIRRTVANQFTVRDSLLDYVHDRTLKVSAPDLNLWDLYRQLNPELDATMQQMSRWIREANKTTYGEDSRDEESALESDPPDYEDNDNTGESK